MDVLCAVYPLNAGYDRYWISIDAIDGRSHTILMCSKCRKDLSSKIVHKFSKRNGFDMFDNHPEELVDLNPLEIALLSIAIPTSRTFRRNRYQQLHGLGQTITYWNSTQTAIDSVPRSALDLPIILMRDEHGRSCIDDAPLRHSRLLAAMRFSTNEERLYDHIRTDEAALADLCRSVSPFILEDHTLYGTGRASGGRTHEECPSFGQHCGGNPLTGVTRPPGMSRGQVVNSHATPP